MAQRNNIETALGLLYKIEMCQAMAMQSDGLDKKFNHVCEYAHLLNEFVPRLHDVLNEM